MKRMVIGYKTGDRSEIGTVVYMGTDGDAEERKVSKSKLYRFEFFQIDRPMKRKIKEENAPAKAPEPGSAKAPEPGSEPADLP